MYKNTPINLQKIKCKYVVEMEVESQTLLKKKRKIKSFLNSY